MSTESKKNASSLSPSAAIIVPLGIGSAVLIVAVFATYHYNQRLLNEQRRKRLTAAHEGFKHCKDLAVAKEYAAAETAIDGSLQSLLGDKKTGKILDYEALSQAYFLRGQMRAYQRLRDKMVGAETDLTKCLRFNPQDYAAYLLRGEVRADLGDLLKAESDFTAAIRIRPLYGLAFKKRAKVRLSLGKNAAATADTLRAKELGE